MSDTLPADVATLLTELVEKVGLLRRDMQQKKELEKYQARFQRIEQKFSALAEHISVTDPDLAKQLRTAWQLPARSLAFRNAAHQRPAPNDPTLQNIPNGPNDPNVQHDPNDPNVQHDPNAPNAQHGPNDPNAPNDPNV